MFPDFHFKTHNYRDAYFMSKSKGRRLKQGDVYFKKRRVILMKLENFVIVSFNASLDSIYIELNLRNTK